MIWVFDKNSGDNTPAVLVLRERYLHKIKDFSITHAALPVRR